MRSSGDLVQPGAPNRASLGRAVSSPALRISSGGESVASLGNLLRAHRGENKWSCIEGESPVFQFVPVVSCAVTGYFWLSWSSLPSGNGVEVKKKKITKSWKLGRQRLENKASHRAQ